MLLKQPKIDTLAFITLLDHNSLQLKQNRPTQTIVSIRRKFHLPFPKEFSTLKFPAAKFSNRRQISTTFFLFSES